MTNPTTWREVEIERARCEGWMQGFVARGRKASEEIRIRIRYLSRLRPCDECEGTGKGTRVTNQGQECVECDGSGIAPGGE